LTVSFMAYLPSASLFWRFRMQLTAHEAFNCTDCALHER
jgi:hypothetical protein